MVSSVCKSLQTSVSATIMGTSATLDCVAIQYNRSGHSRLYPDCPLDRLTVPISRAESSLGHESCGPFSVTRIWPLWQGVGSSNHHHLRDVIFRVVACKLLRPTLKKGVRSTKLLFPLTHAAHAVCVVCAQCDFSPFAALCSSVGINRCAVICGVLFFRLIHEPPQRLISQDMGHTLRPVRNVAKGVRSARTVQGFPLRCSYPSPPPSCADMPLSKQYDPYFHHSPD